jgi:hypothetical protein
MGIPSGALHPPSVSVRPLWKAVARPEEPAKIGEASKLHFLQNSTAA